VGFWGYIRISPKAKLMKRQISSVWGGIFDGKIRYRYGLSSNTDLVDATDGNGASIFTALREELGLKLASDKAPVEVLVIDHIARPSEK
jgi:uncharacterized protein (TIGR03435 family)